MQETQETQVWSLDQADLLEKEMAIHSSILPGKSHGQRSLVGCRPWGRKESDMTEWLHFHVSLSSIGEGNGNPLQCSCLQNHRDGGAWWAAVHGVAQSRTRLMWLSSTSSKAQIMTKRYQNMNTGCVRLRQFIQRINVNCMRDAWRVVLGAACSDEMESFTFLMLV